MSPPKSAKTSLAEKDSNLINLDELCYLLTLRYYPKGSTPLPKLTWRDFVPYPGIETCLQSMLDGALKSTIDSEKPERVGIAISGGVDSTVVLALTRKLYPNMNIKTLCVTFGNDKNELADAQHVAEMFVTDHHDLSVENPIQELPKQIAILGVPRWNTYTYYIFEYFQRNKVNVLLTGDGGDEMFGGYVFRYKQVLGFNTLSAKTYLNTHRMDWVPDQQRMFGAEIKFAWEAIYSTLSGYFRNPLEKLGQTFLADYNGKLLYDFAPTNNSFAKHFGLNMFAPMLNNEVIYAVSHLPYHLKYDHKNNVGKIILRQILLENFAYKSATKPKIGFGMDRVEMWHKTKDSIVSLFDEARCVEMGLIDKEWLSGAVEKANLDVHETRLRYITKLFMILALEVWLRLFVTKEMKATDKL